MKEEEEYKEGRTRRHARQIRCKIKVRLAGSTERERGRGDYRKAGGGKTRKRRCCERKARLGRADGRGREEKEAEKIV